MSLDTTSLSAVAELGYLLMRAGRLDDARALWEGLAGEAGHLEAPWRALALIALRQGRPDDCIAAANIAQQRKPASPAPIVMRAEALRLQGRYAEAEADLQAALALRPRCRADQVVLARAASMARARR